MCVGKCLTQKFTRRMTKTVNQLNFKSRKNQDYTYGKKDLIFDMELPVSKNIVFLFKQTLVFLPLFSVDDCVSSNENLGSVSCIEMAGGGTITMETNAGFQNFCHLGGWDGF